MVAHKVTIDLFERQRRHAFSDRDCVWSILNELLNNYMKNSQYNNLEHVYRLMAEFLKEENKDPTEQVRQANRMHLLHLKQSGYQKVEIQISGRKSDPVPCPVCLSLKNRVLQIEEALRSMPIPPAGCQNKYCYTYYMQVFPF